jgi:phosphoglycerate dehydrogenase-like enzyme
MASEACGQVVARLRGPHEVLAVTDVSRVDDHAADLVRTDVLSGWPLTMEMVRRAPKVRLLQAFGAGVDGLRFDELPPHVQVANTFHHEAAIAEHVIMSMLILSRDPFDDDARMRRGDWDRSVVWGERPVMRELTGRSVLLIGLGHIAREVAMRAKAFRMRVVAASRTATEAPFVDEIVPFERWREKLPDADFIAPTCPLTPETEGLIGARELAMMKPQAVVINVARGKVVEEQALYDALKFRRIAGAAIDVWYQYPSSKQETRYPSRLPFHELPNILMSPHNCGWTNATLDGRIEDVAENINRLAEGRPLLNRLR